MMPSFFFIRRLAAFAVVVWLLSHSAPLGAGEAAVAEGGVIYAIRWDEGAGVVQIDLARKHAEKVAIPKDLLDGDVEELAISNAGHLLLASAKAIVAFDRQTGKGVPVCNSPAGGGIFGLAYDPTRELLFVSVFDLEGNNEVEGLWVLPKGAKELLPVVHRRLDGPMGLAMTPDGRVVLASRGDVWIGVIEPGEGDEAWSFTGERFAPVAEWESTNATSGSYGARHCAVVGDLVLVHTGRLGGSGDGSILAVPLPQPGTTSSSLAAMAKTLSATRIIAELGTQGWLCTNRKGDHAWFHAPGESRELGLMEFVPGQAPREVFRQP